MELRPVTQTDVPAVVSLVRETLAEFGLSFGQGSSTDEQLHALPGSYRSAGGDFFVALERGLLVGTAGVIPVRPGVFELRKMYLSPEARGRGVGKALLDVCVMHCKAAAAKQIVLDTTEQMVRAIAFYEKAGFTRDDAQIRGSRCSRGYRLEL